ncbi:hypothetical protein BDZ94DRAFT_1257717 [Collybia nuda]|uniref:Sulfate transporter n=1 Tax=Collybia nuda TaxID=64659 RepID=A0A9P5Y8V6_9AGAR|nr:hypothetical protein BDZ94DRAFT_1257717 [Collybia nuda]
MGTLLPLMIALTMTGSISLSSTLIFSGLWNVLTGVMFGIPLPVQPMKAIAAVAIARGFSKAEMASAGLFVAGFVLVASWVGAIKWFTKVIPIPVVKGIQIGAGMSLVLSAGGSLQGLHWTSPKEDNLLWTISVFLFLLATTLPYRRLARIPTALILFVIGIVLSVVVSGRGRLPHLSRWRPFILLPSPAAFRTGALEAGVGQIPLTTLNSIIAVSQLSYDLLPNVEAPTTTALGLSVAGMNLVGCWFGAMPVCHGSGGLAAQYRFGARSGASIIILGLFKLVVGLVWGDSLVGVLSRFPKSVLGIMVIAAGLELAKVGESLNTGARDLYLQGEEDDEGESSTAGKRPRQVSDEERMQRWTVMMMTVGGLLAFRNDAVGFVAGMLCHCVYRFPVWWREVRDDERGIWSWRRVSRRSGERRWLLGRS